MYRVVYVYLKQDTFMHGVCLQLTEITYRRFIESLTYLVYELRLTSTQCCFTSSTLMMFDVVQRQ